MLTVTVSKVFDTPPSAQEHQLREHKKDAKATATQPDDKDGKSKADDDKASAETNGVVSNGGKSSDVDEADASKRGL